MSAKRAVGRYVKRLKNSLQEGLYTKTTEEAVIRGWKIKNITRLCFTEIRLSQAQRNGELYIVRTIKIL